ncbi:MAG: hypothetical protein WBG65_01320 [Sulfurimonadaceae bacterium]
MTLALSAFANDEYKIDFDFRCSASTEIYRDEIYESISIIPNDKLIQTMATISTYKSNNPFNGSNYEKVSVKFENINTGSETYFVHNYGDHYYLSSNHQYSYMSPTQKFNFDDAKDFLTTKVDKTKATLSYYTNKYKGKGISRSPIQGKKSIVVLIDREKSLRSLNECKQQIESDKQQRYLLIALLIVAVLGGLVTMYYIIKKIIKKIKKEAKNASEKYEQHKIRKIAEDESIRSSVKKSIDESDDDELKSLQDLINKAVSKGDSETAQALLKILNSKKNN